MTETVYKSKTLQKAVKQKQQKLWFRENYIGLKFHDNFLKFNWLKFDFILIKFRNYVYMKIVCTYF